MIYKPMNANQCFGVKVLNCRVPECKIGLFLPVHGDVLEENIVNLIKVDQTTWQSNPNSLAYQVQQKKYLVDMFAEYTVQENSHKHIHIKPQLCRTGECANAKCHGRSRTSFLLHAHGQEGRTNIRFQYCTLPSLFVRVT